MTLRELNQLRYLRREIQMDAERLVRLEHQNTASDRQQIAELRKIISDKRVRCIRERNRLENHIASVKDSLVRQIMTLRFVDGLSWQGVAMRIGGGNTENNVKKIIHRYLRSHR